MNEADHVQKYLDVRNLFAMAESVVELDEYVESAKATLLCLKKDFEVNSKYCAYFWLQNHYSYYKKILQGRLYVKQ